MICPNCKNEIKDNDLDFCPYCGTYILSMVSEKLTEYHRKELKEVLDKVLNPNKEKKLRKKIKERIEGNINVLRKLWKR